MSARFHMFKERVGRLKRAREGRPHGCPNDSANLAIPGHSAVMKQMYLQTGVQEMDEMAKFVDGQAPT